MQAPPDMSSLLCRVVRNAMIDLAVISWRDPQPSQMAKLMQNIESSRASLTRAPIAEVLNEPVSLYGLAATRMTTVLGRMIVMALWEAHLCVAWSESTDAYRACMACMAWLLNNGADPNVAERHDRVTRYASS
jgi:hypothetical protein